MQGMRQNGEKCEYTAKAPVLDEQRHVHSAHFAPKRVNTAVDRTAIEHLCILHNYPITPTPLRLVQSLISALYRTLIIRMTVVKRNTYADSHVQ